MVHACGSLSEYHDIIKINEFVVVDYFATWCGPCRMISPKLEEFSKTYTKVKFIKVDVDEVPDVASEAGIRAMPTFHIFVQGSRKEEIVGADPRKLEAAIKAVLV